MAEEEELELPIGERRQRLAQSLLRHGLKVLEPIYGDAVIQYTGRVPPDRRKTWLHLVGDTLIRDAVFAPIGVKVEVLERHLWRNGHVKAWVVIFRGVGAHNIDQITETLRSIRPVVAEQTVARLHAEENRNVGRVFPVGGGPGVRG